MLQLDGKSFFVPGAYAVTKILQLGGSNLPVFNVGVIIGKQMSGTPYLAGIGTPPESLGGALIPAFSDINELIRETGDEGDSEVTTYAKYARKMGAGVIFTLNVNPLTRATGGVIQNATPANALTVKTKKFGAHCNDISITIATSIHTIIPPKEVTFLTANSGTGKTISVKNVGKRKAGDVVYLTSNAYVAPVAKTIDSVNATAKTITFTTAIASSALTADYARIFQEDTDNQEVSGTLDTVEKVDAFYAQSRHLAATVESGITLMPVTLAKTYVQNLTSLTKATSPDATANDWQAVATNFQRWNEEFAIANKFYMRVLGLVTSDAANHASFRDMAVTMRTANKPVALVAGCALGDYALASNNAAYPAKRTFTLNSDEIQLAGAGLDGLAAYLSMSGELFGIRLANGVAHNQTRDDLVANSVEVAYFRDDAALATWVKSGVVMIEMTKTGYKVVQGLTTYQDQSTTFNADSKKTHLVMLRDLADYDLRSMLEILDGQVGADGVTAQILSAIVVQTSENLKARGYILDYKITSITKTGNAFVIKRQASLDSPTDFIGLVNSIVLQ